MADCLYSSSEDLNSEPSLNIFENDFNTGFAIRVLKPESEVGIECLSSQYVDRIVRRRQFSFNVMLLGQTGIGKSTLIDSLFKMKFKDDSPRSHTLSEVGVVCDYYDLKENDVSLRLGVIESKGFGDQIIKIESYEPIVEYICQQFDNYLEEELRIDRTPHSTDTRVHVCLYLISPVGHGLKAIDLVTMKALDTKVNLIPVIAKSDLITKSELIQLKTKIMSEIESNDINIYRFPTNESLVSILDSKSDNLITDANTTFPFAVVASNEFVMMSDKKVRARQYPWGIVDVENQSHSDLHSLRDMILRIHLNDLKESTHELHYEHYRSHCLEERWKERQIEHKTQLKAKERELIDNFTAKLKSKELELKKTERELHQRFEQMSKERIEEKMRLDLDKQRLEDDLRALNARKQLLFQQNFKAQESGDRKPLPTPKSRNK